MNLPTNMRKDYEMRAECERKAGTMIDINTWMPWISISFSDGTEYFFQEAEAQDLLDEVPDNIADEDYILAIAQGW